MTATDVRPGPDAPCRVLIAPCGCLVGGDITMSGLGFCRTRAEADEDAARGYREEVRTVAEFRAARRCGDATWHTPGDAPRATTGPSPTVAATKAGGECVRPVPPARDAVTLGYDEASRVPVLLAEKAALMGDVDRLTAERDGARGMRVIATRAFETARRVLQEASGLPDDIDDPDCRDEMVLALRPRAEKAEAENARLVEEATVSAALLEIEIAKRESAEMRANRATADLDALESEDRRQDVQAKHWREVLRIRRELDGIRQEMNDATEIIAKALGYRPSGLPLDGWPHLSTTGDHTPTSLAAEAAGVLAKASRLRAGIEALAAEMQSDTCPACHASYADEGSTTWGCDHTEGMQHAGDMLRALLAEGGE